MNLTRLYWYTVEFGLIRQGRWPAHLRQRHRQLQGRIHPLPGIGRAQPHRFRPGARDAHALPHRHLPEDLLRHRRFRPAAEATRPDFTLLYAQRLREQASLPAGEVQAGDRAFQRGTGEGWLTDGDVPRWRARRGLPCEAPVTAPSAPAPRCARTRSAAAPCRSPTRADGDQSPHHPWIDPWTGVHKAAHFRQWRARSRPLPLRGTSR